MIWIASYEDCKENAIDLRLHRVLATKIARNEDLCGRHGKLLAKAEFSHLSH
jgi:hypothetical protein